MQPSCTRLLCRAHNRFTPSIVLWQHFVLPTQVSLHQQRLSSLATEAASDSKTQDDNLLFAKRPSSLEHSEALTAKPERQNGQASQDLRLRRTIWKRIAGRGKQHGSTHTSRTRAGNYLDEAKVAFNADQDYRGVVMKPMVNPHPVKESQLPWCLRPEERTTTGYDRLTIEIERFCEFAKPNRFENIARKHVIEQVRGNIHEKLPGHMLEIFGSERTGIALATSDIDFRLLPQSHLSDPALAKKPPSRAHRSQSLKDLHKLHKFFVFQSKTYLLPTILHARYPLITLQDRNSGLDVQIVLANDTSLSRVIMSDYMEQYPYLRPLYYVVKTMLDVRGLSEVFQGGFGSYPLFMMVVASIRHNPHPQKDAAGGLINFLKFWSHFDTTKYSVSIEPACLYDKASQPVMTGKVKEKIEGGASKPLPAYMLCLRDPADETNDLGRKGFAIKHVQTTFRSLLRELLDDIRTNVRPSLLAPLVGPSYMLDYASRATLEKYGKLLLNQIQEGKAMTVENIESKVEEEMKRQTMEEEDQDRLARQERDREWQRLAEEKNGLMRKRVDTNDSGSVEESLLDASAPAEKTYSSGTP